MTTELNRQLIVDEEARTANTGLAKVAVQCSADTFVVNQILVLRINICGKIANFAKPQNVITHCRGLTFRKTINLTTDKDEYVSKRIYKSRSY